MSDALAVSPPSAASSPKKIEKTAADKTEGAPGTDEEAREFANVLEQAFEAPVADAATPDLTAAIPASQLSMLAADGTVPEDGEFGVGGAPLTDARHPATLLPLRPEARAALQAAQPEAAAAMKAAAGAVQDAAADAQPDATQAANDDAKRFDSLGAPGKPFEQLLERAGSMTPPRIDSADAAPAESPPSTPLEAVTETARRERPAILKLDTGLPVQTPRFNEGFSQQVVVLAQHGIQQAQLSLTPPDLGPVDVRITIANDEASVQIAAPSGVAREAIQEALPRLKEMMEQSGVRLNDAGVFAQLPERDRSGSAQSQTEGWQQRGSRGGQPGDMPEVPVSAVLRPLGLIDAYA